MAPAGKDPIREPPAPCRVASCTCSTESRETHPMHDVSISRFPAVRRSRPRPIWFCPSTVCSRSLHSGSRLCSKPKLQTMRKFLSPWSLMQGWGLPLPGAVVSASSRRGNARRAHRVTQVTIAGHGGHGFRTRVAVVVHVSGLR